MSGERVQIKYGDRTEFTGGVGDKQKSGGIQTIRTHRARKAVSSELTGILVEVRENSIQREGKVSSGELKKGMGSIESKKCHSGKPCRSEGGGELPKPPLEEKHKRSDP